MPKDFAKFGKTNFKTLFNISSIWMSGRKGLFEHKLTLCSLSSVQNGQNSRQLL
jgi:hypothetical protein